MGKVVTIREVAERAGVSIATASRVLSGSPNTSEASRQAVTRAADELHYAPNGPARSLRMAKSHSVGLLVSDIRNPYFSELAYAVQTALFEQNYCMLLGNASEQDVLQDQYLLAIQQQRVDGLIAAPQGQGSELLTRLAHQGLPIVFVDRTLEVPDVPFIVSDPEPGIGQTLDRLYELGHRRVAFIAGPQNSSTGTWRRRVFETLANPRFEAKVYLGGYDESQCRDAVAQALADGHTALVFGYSPNTVTALAVIQERGLVIPDDISVVSFDEISAFEANRPQIAHISQGVSEMGRGAVGMLFELLGGVRPADRLLPTELRVRDSIGAAPERKL